MFFTNSITWNTSSCILDVAKNKAPCQKCSVEKLCFSFSFLFMTTQLWTKTHFLRIQKCVLKESFCLSIPFLSYFPSHCTISFTNLRVRCALKSLIFFQDKIHSYVSIKSLTFMIYLKWDKDESSNFSLDFYDMTSWLVPLVRSFRAPKTEKFGNAVCPVFFSKLRGNIWKRRSPLHSLPDWFTPVMTHLAACLSQI